LENVWPFSLQINERKITCNSFSWYNFLALKDKEEGSRNNIFFFPRDLHLNLKKELLKLIGNAREEPF
jgi:hypothetical protein